jgi:signal transduction histidine kinase
LRIRDDGKGFDPEQKLSGHYGQGMMRERAEAAGRAY